MHGVHACGAVPGGAAAAAQEHAGGRGAEDAVAAVDRFDEHEGGTEHMWGGGRVSAAPGGVSEGLAALRPQAAGGCSARGGAREDAAVRSAVTQMLARIESARAARCSGKEAQ